MATSRFSGLERGWTLAEVVVGLTLFAMISVVLLQSVNYGLTALEHSQEEDSLDYALGDLRRQVLLVGSLDEMEKGGEGRTSRGERFRWKAELSQTLLVDYFHVHLNVEFPSREGSEETREMEFYIYRPGWSGSSERETLTKLRQERFREQREGGRE